MPCRLLWGTAGASNALAVAEGLGFSPSVIKEAREVAANTRMITDTTLRNETLVSSLHEQVGESKASMHFSEYEIRNSNIGRR